MTTICKKCGKAYDPTGRYDRYCSDVCGAAAMGDAMARACEKALFDYVIYRPEVNDQDVLSE